MTTEMFEAKLTSWFAEEAPVGMPTALTERVLDGAAGIKQLPTWRAMLGSPVMRTQSTILVGSPGWRLVRLAVVTLLMAAAITTTAVAGAVIVHALRPAQAIVFASRDPIGFTPDPVPNFRDCGNDQACLDKAFGAGPHPLYIYTVNPEGTDGPQLAATMQINQPLGVGAPSLSADGRFVAFPTPAYSCSMGLSVSDLKTGSTQTLQSSNLIAWSPNGHSLLTDAITCDSATGNETSRELSVFDPETGTSRSIADEGPTGPDDERVDPVGWLGNDQTLLIARAKNCRRPDCRPDYTKVELGDEALVFTGLPQLNGIAVSSLSPDGRTVLYSPTGEETYLMGIDGSDARSLGTDCMGQPSWSRDSRYLTYSECPKYDDQGANITTPDTSVVVVDVLDGSKRVVGTSRQSDGNGLITNPAFAPDNSVIYWSDPTGTWTVKPDGTGLTQLDLPPGTQLAWSLAGH